METGIRPVLNKAFSVFVSISLALLMVPMAPREALADDGDWALGDEKWDTGLAKAVVVNNLDAADNSPITQALDTDKIDDAINGSFAAPSTTASETIAALGDDVSEAAKADLKSVAQAAAVTNDAKNITAKLSDDQAAIDEAAKDWLSTSEGQTEVAKAEDSAKTAAETELANAGITNYTDLAVKFKEATISAAGDTLMADSLAIQSEDTDLTVNNPAVLSTGSVAYDVNEPNSFSVVSVEALQNGIVKDVSIADGNLTFTAEQAGETAFKLGYKYQLNVTGYQFTYAGSYSLAYNKAVYKNWKFKPSFTFTYKDDNGEEKEGSAPVEGDEQSIASATIDYSGTTSTNVSYTDSSPATATNRCIASGVDQDSTFDSDPIEVVDLFPDALDRSDYAAQELTYYADRDGKSVSEVFADFSFGTNTDRARSHALAQIVPASASSASTGGSFSVSYDSDADALKLVPVKVINGGTEDTASFTWTLPGTGGTVTHTIQATVHPYKISCSVEPLPFRAEEKNARKALAAANNNVRKAIKDECGDTINSDFYSGVSFKGYDGNGISEKTFTPDNPATTVIWEKSGSAGSDYGNYAVNIDGDPSVTVAAMKQYSWREIPGLTLNANATLTSGNAGEQWVNSVPTAMYANHKLAYAPAKQNLENASAFGSSAALDKGDGEHALDIYVEDNDEVISRVTGVSYMLDTQAPVLTGFEASGVRREGGVLFGKNKVDVQLGIADLNEGGVTSATNTSTKVSGLDGTPKVTYRDAEAKKDITADGKFSSNVYSFTVDSNQDVPASSIQVEAQDKAGNKLDTTADKSRNIPVEITRLVAEGDKPELSVSWDNNDVRNGRYYSSDRTMTITVTDHFFNYIVDYANDQAVANIYKGGSSEPSITVHPSDFKSAGSNKWTYSLSFTAENDWKVSTVSIRDVVGNSASAKGDSFTIDKSAPSMDVVFDNDNATNGNYYNAARTATITVTEHNFVESLLNIETTANAGNGDTVGSPNVSGWSSDGDVHAATVNFPGEGVYTLSVSGKDGADNTLAAYTASEFVIDTQAPQIDISGVGNREAYSGSAQPSVTVRDTNVSDATSIELSKVGYPAGGEDANPYNEARSNATTEISVSYPDAPESVENDGVYTITVQATDMAGNTADQAVTWSVNRFGSTYVIADDTSKMLNNYLKSDKVGNVVVTEINPSSLNEDATAIELTHDTSNSTLKRDADYSIESNGSSGWSEYTYSVAKKNFGSDGAYRVLFHSEDAASNTSENTMKNKNASRSDAAEVAFAVDDTSPVVSFVDLASNGLYEESTHTAQVSIQDNLKPESAVVKVDGQPVLDLDAAALADSTTHSFDVPESAIPHEVTVTAYDAAGNAETISAPNVTVTTDPMKLWMNNAPLFVGTIVGGVVVIGAVAALFVFRFRRPTL